MGIFDADLIAAKLLLEALQSLRSLFPAQSAWKYAKGDGFFGNTSLGIGKGRIGVDVGTLNLELRKQSSAALLAVQTVSGGTFAKLPTNTSEWLKDRLGKDDAVPNITSGGILLVPAWSDDFVHASDFGGACAGVSLDLAIGSGAGIMALGLGIDPNYSRRWKTFMSNMQILLKQVGKPVLELQQVAAGQAATKTSSGSSVDLGELQKGLYQTWKDSVMFLVQDLTKFYCRGVLYMAGISIDPPEESRAIGGGLAYHGGWVTATAGTV